MQTSTPTLIFAPMPSRSAALALADVLESEVPAVTAMEDPVSGLWTVEAVLEQEADQVELATRAALLAASQGWICPEPRLIRLAEKDWVAHVYAQLRPVRAGRFWVHGSHVADPPPRHAIRLTVDAAAAFGTGEHPTTQGCLILLDRLERQGHLPPVSRPRVLDLGCGTAVLAMAAARILPRARILATDIDPPSIIVARRFLAMNRLEQIRTLAVAGLKHRALNRAGSHDLILANILPRPLIRLAPGIRRGLAPGGVLILAGLLRRQARAIVTAYRRVGLRPLARLDLAGWTILAFSRPRGGAGDPPDPR